MQRALIGRSRVLGAIVVAVALATGVYAFTATNTVPGSSAGSGSGTISGYTVSNVQYQLNATTPSDIDSVTFTLSAPATQARAKVVAGATPYTTCSIAVNNVDVTCNFSPDIAVASADELTVIATS
jgi:hypothetical protein